MNKYLFLGISWALIVITLLGVIAIMLIDFVLGCFLGSIAFYSYAYYLHKKNEKLPHDKRHYQD